MWYLVLRAAVKPRAEWTVSLDEILEWAKRQHEAGAMVFSGPTRDHKMAIFLLRADSRKEAERVAASDPSTAAGLCDFDLYEWEVHQILGAGPFSTADMLLDH